jgi:hypothetical protein
LRLLLAAGTFLSDLTSIEM